MDYIPINSLKDLDPRKISIRDINKRYIDREGNRFATRYNMQKRCIEIVRLARNRLEAQKMRGDIMRGKHQAFTGKKGSQGNPDLVSQEAEENPSSTEISFDDFPKPNYVEKNQQSNKAEAIEEFSEDDGLELDATDAKDIGATEEPSPVSMQESSNSTIEEADSTSILEQQFLEDASILLSRMKDRQLTILNAIKNLQGSVIENQEVSEINREMDLTCWQKSEESVNYYKELYGYPRSISHYTIRLHPDLKERLSNQTTDEDRMVIIKRNESARTFEETLYNYYNMTDRLYKILQKVSAEDLKRLPMALAKQVKDAHTSSHMLLKDIREKQSEFKKWRNKYC